MKDKSTANYAVSEERINHIYHPNLRVMVLVVHLYFLCIFKHSDSIMRFHKVLPKEVIDLLTESQSQIHLGEPWFHRGLSRDVAQKILATHNVDG